MVLFINIINIYNISNHNINLNINKNLIIDTFKYDNYHNELDKRKNYSIYWNNQVIDFYNKRELNLKDSVAIIVCGQVRTFLEERVYKSFKNSIVNSLEKNNINYHFFFLLEPKCEYYEYSSKESIKHNKYNINKTYIEDTIKKITDKYSLYFYNINDIINELPYMIHDSFLIQNYIAYKSYQYIKKFEIKNNIKYKYILKTRPDIKLDNNFKLYDFLLNNIYDNMIFKSWDYLFIIPRFLFSIFFDAYLTILNPRIDDILSLQKKYITNFPSKIFENHDLYSFTSNFILDVHLYNYGILLYWKKICSITRPL